MGLGVCGMSLHVYAWHVHQVSHHIWKGAWACVEAMQAVVVRLDDAVGHRA